MNNSAKANSSARCAGAVGDDHGILTWRRNDPSGSRAGGAVLRRLRVLPELSHSEVLEENRSWLQPTYIDAAGRVVLCIQSYLVRTPRHTILIDTCVGNHKPRPRRPFWDKMANDRYERGLAATGLSVRDVDYVMCTHLHVDHVGWNTRLANGRWVPTFPRARYVFAERELNTGRCGFNQVSKLRRSCARHISRRDRPGSWASRRLRFRASAADVPPDPADRRLFLRDGAREAESARASRRNEASGLNDTLDSIGSAWRVSCGHAQGCGGPARAG